MKGLKPYPLRLIMADFQHRKVNYHVHFRFLCTILKNSDKIVLVERIWLVIIQIKTSTHEANIT